MRRLDGIVDSMDISLNKLWKIVKDRDGPCSSKIYTVSVKRFENICCCCCYVALVVSDSVRPHRLQPTRLPCPGGFSRQEHWSGLLFPSPMHESEK